jgi:hypothetical protein
MWWKHPIVKNSLRRRSLSPGCKESVEKDVEKGMELEGRTGYT